MSSRYSRRFQMLALAIVPLGLAAGLVSSAPAEAFGGENCRTVIRSTARGGNYTLCSPKGTMKCEANRCTITKAPPASRTAGRPAKR